jgi:hypothetical protein
MPKDERLQEPEPPAYPPVTRFRVLEFFTKQVHYTTPLRSMLYVFVNG